ncbi:RidA family protein [bacterium]|nr:RidA family protein [bacterium]
MITRYAIGCCLLVALGCASQRTDFASDRPALPYSKAVLSGNTLYVAGHIGVDPATDNPPAAATDEARMMLDAFAATIARAGLAMDDLVEVQVFCSDNSLYNSFNDIYRLYFDRRFPARTFITSGTLVRGCRFEISGTAIKP